MDKLFCELTRSCVQVEQEQNIGFGQISAVLNLMLELGGVPVEQVSDTRPRPP